jgi:hypothetical protein
LRHKIGKIPAHALPKNFSIATYTQKLRGQDSIPTPVAAIKGIVATTRQAVKSRFKTIGGNPLLVLPSSTHNLLKYGSYRLSFLTIKVNLVMMVAIKEIENSKPTRRLP